MLLTMGLRWVQSMRVNSKGVIGEFNEMVRGCRVWVGGIVTNDGFCADLPTCRPAAVPHLFVCISEAYVMDTYKV